MHLTDQRSTRHGKLDAPLELHAIPGRPFQRRGTRKHPRYGPYGMGARAKKFPLPSALARPHTRILGDSWKGADYSHKTLAYIRFLNPKTTNRARSGPPMGTAEGGTRQATGPDRLVVGSRPTPRAVRSRRPDAGALVTSSAELKCGVGRSDFRMRDQPEHPHGFARRWCCAVLLRHSCAAPLPFSTGNGSAWIRGAAGALYPHSPFHN